MFKKAQVWTQKGVPKYSGQSTNIRYPLPTPRETPETLHIGSYKGDITNVATSETETTLPGHHGNVRGKHLLLSDSSSTSFSLSSSCFHKVTFNGSESFFLLILLFFYLVALGVSCNAWDVKLQHVGSSSLTRNRTWVPFIGKDWTQALCIGSVEFLATGPSEKSLYQRNQ